MRIYPSRRPLLLTGLVLGALLLTARAAQATDPSAARAELAALDARVDAKDRAGKVAPADYAEEFAAFDALLAKYQGQQTEEIAAIALGKAFLSWELNEGEAALQRNFLAVTTGFPGTKSAATAERLLKDHAVLTGLTGRTAPELHFQWANRPGLTALSALRGQVVVLDFWATWCGPCIRSFPEIRAHAARFKGLPVVFLGVTSIQGRVANLGPAKIDTKGDPAREMALMTDFMKAKEMTWDVVFSEEPVFNPAYGISGIPFVAIIAPDGTVRHAGLHPGHEQDDLAGKVTALLREFHLPVPAGQP